MSTGKMTEHQKNICLYPECESGAYSRGLCSAHYQSAHGLVTNGKITWKELEKLGKALPPIYPGRKIKSVWFLQPA